MNRRGFAAALAAILAAAPPLAYAQPAQKVQRVAYLNMSTPAESELYVLGPLRRALASLGYVEGRNIAFDARHGDYKFENLPTLVQQLVASKPDVFVAIGTPIVAAVRRSVKTVPVVMAYCYDPVASGFVRDLARPGANITGICLQGGAEIFAKTVDIASALARNTRRIAFLTYGRDDPSKRQQLDEVQRAAGRHGMTLLAIDANTPEQLESAFAEIARQRADLVIVPDYAFFLSLRHKIIALAAESRIPAVYQARYYVDAGGLVSYAPSLREQVTEAAGYVDRILRGANPADLPVQLSRQYELVLNLKTARALGIQVPGEILVRADEVID